MKKICDLFRKPQFSRQRPTIPAKTGAKLLFLKRRNLDIKACSLHHKFHHTSILNTQQLCNLLDLFVSRMIIANSRKTFKQLTAKISRDIPGRNRRFSRTQYNILATGSEPICHTSARVKTLYRKLGIIHQKLHNMFGDHIHSMVIGIVYKIPLHISGANQMAVINRALPGRTNAETNILLVPLPPVCLKIHAVVKFFQRLATIFPHIYNSEAIYSCPTHAQIDFSLKEVPE